MTRETKVGIVVAVSFLSLVGGVLGVKYIQNRQAASTQTADAEPPVQTINLADHVAVVSAFQYCWQRGFITQDFSGKIVIDAPRPQPVVPAAAPELTLGNATPAKPMDPPILALPDPSASPAKNEPLVVNTPTTEPGGPTGLVLPMPDGPPKLPDALPKPLATPTGIVPVAGGDAPKSAAESGKDKEKKPDPASAGLVIGPSNTNDKPAPMAAGPGALVIPGSGAPTPNAKIPEPVPVPVPPPAPIAQPFPTPAGNTVPLPNAPAPKPVAPEIPKVEMPIPPSAPSSKPETIPVPTPMGTSAATVSLPGTEVKEKAAPAPVPSPSLADLKKNTPAALPGPLGPPPKSTPVPTPADAAGVRLGAPTPGLDSASERPAVVATEQRLDSYEEEWYRCVAGDTLEKISQKFFYTTKYASALRQYNLDRHYHKNLSQENSSLEERQIIRIPPARVLEMKYPTTAPGLRPASGSRMIPASGSSFTASGTANADRPESTTAMEYKVPRPNMTLRDIAKEQFGNSDQWRRIFLLNRWLNPMEPVPEGTMIFVPRQ